MFRKSIKSSLVLVYLVIIAGAVVRMTGSGMGCPDWPKCFGHLIPPTQKEELEWHPQQSFHKGQVIIKDGTLQVATSDFTSEKNFNSGNWKFYTKHNYAKFNPTHTWVEFINRLFGMLSGIAIFIMAIASFWKWKIKKRFVFLSWLSVVLIGFQAWLGATVVYSVLAPVKITIHMVMALVIVAVLLYLLSISRQQPSSLKFNKQFRNLLFISVLFTLFQVVSGTQVRQFVDEQLKLLGYSAKGEWLRSPTIWFYVHRTFSIALIVLNAYLWWQNRRLKLGFKKMEAVFALVIFEIIIGIALYYFDFPFLSQPLHLVLAVLLFGLQFYILLQAIMANPSELKLSRMKILYKQTD